MNGSSDRGGQDAVLDPQLMPDNASPPTGNFVASPYAQPSSDAGVSVGYRQHQPYYIPHTRMSTGSSMDEKPVDQDGGYIADDAQQE